MRRTPQRGNVFFLILLGVALFAAVSIAVVQTTQGGKDISREKARLQAETIMRYAREAKDGVNRMYRNGVSEADLRFAHPKMATEYGSIATTPTNQLFADNGGGLPYTPPPSGIAGTSNWEFYATSAIPQVGSDAADLVMVLRNLNVNICRQINALNGASETATIPTDSNGDGKCIASNAASTDRFVGTFTTGVDIHAPGTTNQVNVPAYQSCVNCGGVYSYYNVILER